MIIDKDTFIPLQEFPDNVKYRKLNKSTGKRFCDELWTLCVKLKFGGGCAICQSHDMINAHHLISKRISAFRWTVNNGVTLCPNHHKFSLELSAHTTPWSFEEWMKNNLPEEYEEWIKKRNNVPDEFDLNYERIYHELENWHFEKTGNYYKIERLNDYLLAFHLGEIKQLHENGGSINKIMGETGAGRKAVTEFMKKNKLIKRTRKKRQTKQKSS